MRKLMTVLLALVLFVAACGNSNDNKTEDKKSEDSKEKVSLTISAAASLKDALSDIEKEYEKEHPNVDIKYNFGASGMLANQIKSGAPVDIFFSAAQDKMDDLIKEDLIKKDNSKTLLKNKLVVVSEKDIKDLNDLTKDDIKKIAVGTPDTVPAGEYAKEALTKADLWNKIEDKIVFTKDVRQALTYVESGNTDAGLVYLTDAKTTKLKTFDVEDSLHDPITYPIGLVKDNKDAKELYDYLQNDASKKVYEKYGFIVE